MGNFLHINYIPTKFRLLIAVALISSTLFLAIMAATDGVGAQQSTSPCENGTVVPTPSENGGLVADCELLWAMKAGFTNGDDKLSSWNATTALGQWVGVQIYGTGNRVKALSLYDLSLAGTISMPASLVQAGGLSELTHMYLDKNKLSGSIPSELGSLSKLTWLKLSDNRLGGSIPSKLGGLSNLIYLYLNGNQLGGSIPSKLGSLSNLTYMYLNDNKLEGSIPSKLGNMSKLVVLHLGDNKLSGSIPSELGSLSNLQGMSLEDNGLSGSIPSELGGLSKMTWIKVAGNQLTGCIPVTLRRVTANDFGKLGLPYCDAVSPTPSTTPEPTPSTTPEPTPSITPEATPSTTPEATPSTTPEATPSTTPEATPSTTPAPTPSTTPSPTPRQAIICSNGVVVPNPSENGGLVADCELLWAMKSGFTNGDDKLSSWNATTALGHWVGVQIYGTGNRVKALSLYDLSLAGTISMPASLVQAGGLSELTHMYLDKNKLSGSIPSELGSLSKLTWLKLSDNRLGGSIPSELGSLSNLIYIYLNGNQLGGSIPSKLGSLSNLTYMYLNDNQLSGSIPSKLGNMSKLVVLHLGDNKLSGSIPSELGSLSNLQGMSLEDNGLSGSIPSELGGLSKMTWIKVAGNQLTGCIPVTLRRVTANDFGKLGLPYCDAVSPTPSPTPSTTPAPTPSPTPGTTPAPTPGQAIICSNGVVVPNPSENEGLVADCELLWAMKSGFTNGDALLTSWNADTAISDWAGLRVSNQPARVRSLSLANKALTGTISMPASLVQAGGLSNLTFLLISGGRMSGGIPSELGNLSNLETLNLSNDQLSGEIPSELGSLSNLEELFLHNNRLSGGIPSELGSLSSLDSLLLVNNQFSGCIPAALRDVEYNDLDELGLSYCDDTTSTSTPTPTPTPTSTPTPVVGKLPTDDPPLNFRVAGFGADHIGLAWETPYNRGITNYVLHRYEHNGTEFVSSQLSEDGNVSGGGGATLASQSLTPDTLYRYDLTLRDDSDFVIIQEFLQVRTRATSAPPEQSDDASLSKLALSGVEFDTQFSTTSYRYSGSVANDTTQTTVTATASDSAASYAVKLGGTVDDDGVIDLVPGRNVITVHVTAKDGVTTRIYTVVVSRAKLANDLSSNASLRSLSLRGVDIGTFDSGTSSYSAQVAHEVSETTVTVMRGDVEASHEIELDGARDADGVIPLNVGENVITVKVTAEDGETTHTYTVTITRAESAVSDPEPTPTPEPIDTCVQSVEANGTVEGSWDDACLSGKEAPGGAGERYACFYTFTLDESADIVISLRSDEDTYLYVRDGHGKNGDALHEHDDIENFGLDTNSRLSVTLEPGSYTIEATTYLPQTSGDFTLAIEGLGEAEVPSPIPRPEPEVDACVESVDADGTIEGSWVNTCPSGTEAEPWRGYKYSRFYMFTLDEASDVTITLKSDEDTYLYLLKGHGRHGEILFERDDIVLGEDTNSELSETMDAGNYTIEATTYYVEKTGDFTLTIAGLAATQ